MMRRTAGGTLAALLACSLLAALPLLARAAPREPALIAVDIATRVEGREGNDLGSLLFRLLDEALAQDYGGWIDLAPAQAGIPAARVLVEGSPDALTVRSVYSLPGGAPRTAVSRVSEIDLLVPVLAGHLLALWAGDRPEDAFPLAAPPAHVLSLATSSLSQLLGSGVETEVTDIAWGPEGLVLALPRGPLSLDPLFRVTPATVRDISAAQARPLESPVVGLRAPLTGRRLMLLADQHTLLLDDEAAGESRSLVLEGGPYAGLVAMPWGGFALWRQAEGEAAVEVLVGREIAGETRLTRFRISPALATAVAADYDGTLWIYDAVERRIRLFDRWGRETHAIQPLVDRAALPLPREIDVYPDGSFIIAGAGEVWKLDRGGVPLWRLRSIDGAGRRALPGSFRFALHGARGTFSLLDPESQEIHVFMDRPLPDGAGAQAAMSDPEARLALFAREPGRSAAAIDWCLDNDLTVIAAGLLGPPRSGEPRTAALQRRRLERAAAEQLARGAAAQAERRAASLDLRGADPFYARAIEGFRALRASFPAERALAEAIETLTSRRQQLRETLVGFLDAGIRVRAPTLHGMLAARSARGETSGASLAVALALPGGQKAPTLEGVVAEIAAARGIEASVLPLGDLSSDREVRIPLELDRDTGLVEEDLPLAIGLRLSGTVEQEVVSSIHVVSALLASRLRFDARWYLTEPPDAAAPSRADFLAWLAATPDPCVLRLRESLIAPAESPLEAAAAVFELLADTVRLDGPRATGEAQAPRQTAHSLRGTGEDALLLAASLLDGIGRAFLTLDGATYLLVETGAPLDRVAGYPVLSRLAELAAPTRSSGRRGATLLPLAAPARTGGIGALEGAARRALEELDAARLAGASIAWVEGGGAPVRAPYLPAYAVPLADLAERARADAQATRALLGN